MLIYFVFVFYIMHVGNCEDPKSCSQFYYVDKLLDKMIRMEVKVENVDKGITKTNSDVLESLEEIKREREEFKNEIMELKKQIQQDVIAGGWSDWGTWSDCSITCGGGIRTRSRTCTNPAPSDQGAYCMGDPIQVDFCNVDICPESMMTPNVVFKARTVNDKSPAKRQTLIFTATLFNYGNGYNPTTGIFTVPFNGTYLFTAQLCVYIQRYFNYALVYDDNVLTSGYLFDQNAYTCHTFDGMVPLTAGQRVWIKCLSASSGDTLYESSSSTGNRWNTFSGMLIHK